jgi:hypothetical protein
MKKVNQFFKNSFVLGRSVRLAIFRVGLFFGILFLIYPFIAILSKDPSSYSLLYFPLVGRIFLYPFLSVSIYRLLYWMISFLIRKAQNFNFINKVYKFNKNKDYKYPNIIKSVLLGILTICLLLLLYYRSNVLSIFLAFQNIYRTNALAFYFFEFTEVLLSLIFVIIELFSLIKKFIKSKFNFGRFFGVLYFFFLGFCASFWIMIVVGYVAFQGKMLYLVRLGLDVMVYVLHLTAWFDYVIVLTAILLLFFVFLSNSRVYLWLYSIFIILLFIIGFLNLQDILPKQFIPFPVYGYSGQNALFIPMTYSSIDIENIATVNDDGTHFLPERRLHYIAWQNKDNLLFYDFWDENSEAVNVFYYTDELDGANYPRPKITLNINMFSLFSTILILNIIFYDITTKTQKKISK